MIAVTVLGVVRRRRRCAASGAQPGDVVALAGRQGWAAAGLAVLGRGFRSPRALVEALPAPAAAVRRRAAAPPRRGATAMIDVSDGLLADARPRRRGQRRRDRHPQRRLRDRRAAAGRRRRARASTRCSSSSAEATTTRWWRRSRPAPRCPQRWRRDRAVRDGSGPGSPSTARPTTAPTGHQHFRLTAGEDNEDRRRSTEPSAVASRVRVSVSG